MKPGDLVKIKPLRSISRDEDPWGNTTGIVIRVIEQPAHKRVVAILVCDPEGLTSEILIEAKDVEIIN